jgi:esterase/lipase superfamily enzyme
VFKDAYVGLLYDGALKDVAPVVAQFAGSLVVRSGTLNELREGTPVGMLHLVADDDGQDRLLPDQAAELSAALERVRPDILLLDSCYSPAEAQALTGRVPHIIGLPGRMGRENANVFLARWYEEYQTGRAVLDAFDEAFDAIPGLDLPDLLRPGYHNQDEERSLFRGQHVSSSTDVTVWYGTNRVPADPGEADPYGVLVDDQLHLGRCVVRIPDHVEYGRVKSRPGQRTTGLTGEYTLAGHQHLAPSDYWADLARALDGAPFDRRDAVVHIRGYRCLFREAAIASAQLHVDLKVRGVSAFYSFPSRGTRSGYWADDDAAQHAERYLYDYLRALAVSPAIAKVHVIAYSMGNRPLLRAAMRAAYHASESGGLRLGQVVLAGADVAQHFFRNEAACFREMAEGVTLYVSSDDKALKGSALFHLTPRAGQAPPLTIVDGIATIDVSNVDTSLLGHGYFQRAGAVLNDLHALLSGEPDPADRVRLKKQHTEDGRSYWRFRA